MIYGKPDWFRQRIPEPPQRGEGWEYKPYFPLAEYIRCCDVVVFKVFGFRVYRRVGVVRSWFGLFTYCGE